MAATQLRRVTLRRPAPPPASTVKPAPRVGKPLARPKPSGAEGGVKTSTANSDMYDGFAKGREERARGNALMERIRARPFDFFVPRGKKSRVIILDAKAYFFHEHRWQGKGGKWNRWEVCLKDDGVPCPACSKLGREGTWVMALTIIDLTPYTPKSGPNAGKTIKRSRKLLKVKGNVLDKWERNFKGVFKENFRGIVLDIHRSNAQKSPNSGDDFEIVMQDGKIRRLTEAEIAKYGPELTAPTDWEKGFKPLDAETLQWYMGAKAGQAVGSEDLEEEPQDDDEVPF